VLTLLHLSLVRGVSASTWRKLGLQSERAAQVTDPDDACEPVERPYHDGRPWIGLIVRSERLRTNCSFDVKVTSALVCLRAMAVPHVLSGTARCACHSRAVTEAARRLP